jgi:hypothetical protein
MGESIDLDTATGAELVHYFAQHLDRAREEARRDALLALRETVEGLPSDAETHRIYGSRARGCAVALDRNAVLLAIDHQLGEG